MARIETITIEGEFADLNHYINAERSNRFMGAKIKKDETEKAYWSAKQSKLKPFDKPVSISFYWTMKDKRKDPDNFCFARKFILDGFVQAGLLLGDGQKHITSFSERWAIGSPKVEVLITES